MKRNYKVNAINENNEVLFTNECKNVKEVKNVIASLNGRYLYTVTKKDKLVKRLSSKKAMEIINNFNLF
jgi:hypothetical protein